MGCHRLLRRSLGAVLVSLALFACRPAAPPPQAPMVPPASAGPWAPGGLSVPPRGGATAPVGPGVSPGLPSVGPSPTAPPGPPAWAYDPISSADVSWLRAQAAGVLQALVAALPPPQAALVANIPLVADPTPGDINAFAACSRGEASMAVTDGLLEVESQLARTRALDELFGTQLWGAYVQRLAAQLDPAAPLPRFPLGVVPAWQEADPRKVARQRQLLDEGLAFILGHELAHHYLGHTGCATGRSSGRLSPADVARVLSDAVPMFNQPNEVAADVAGVQNLLRAGRARPEAAWTEGGSLLTLQFFASLDQLTPETVVFAFERSHPPPQLRSPIVQSSANAWRASGGVGLPIPPLGGFFGN